MEVLVFPSRARAGCASEIAGTAADESPAISDRIAERLSCNRCLLASAWREMTKRHGLSQARRRQACAKWILSILGMARSVA